MDAARLGLDPGSLAVLLRRQKFFPVAVMIAAVAAGFAIATWKTARIAHGVLARPMFSVSLTGFVETRDIRERTDRFVLRGFTMQPDLSHWRWTVDKPADLELVRSIFAHFADQPLVGHQAVIAWLNDNPELLAINAGTIRHEGYFKTLATEQKQ